MKTLNSSGYGTSRLGTGKPEMVNGVSLIDDQSSSMLFTTGRTKIGNRPFSTQGYNEDFKLNESMVNPQRNSTLESVQHVQKGKKGR